MITITFEGELNALCPDPISLNVKTPRQALEALKVHPALDGRLTPNRYEAEIVGLKGASALDMVWAGTTMVIRHLRTITRLSGAGGVFKNPVVRLVVAVIIIVVALYFGNVAVAGEAFQLGFAGSLALNIGIALAAGALMEILAPSPDDNDKRSHLANDYGNTVAAGTPIPIILGEHLWGGHYISYNTNPRHSGSGWYSGGGGGQVPSYPNIRTKLN